MSMLGTTTDHKVWTMTKVHQQNSLYLKMERSVSGRTWDEQKYIYIDIGRYHISCRHFTILMQDVRTTDSNTVRSSREDNRLLHIQSFHIVKSIENL